MELGFLELLVVVEEEVVVVVAAVAGLLRCWEPVPRARPSPPPPSRPCPPRWAGALELQLHSEKTKVVELSRRCQQLELKVNTFENIVCVLNREVERSVATMETYNGQHRLDQDKIEILSNKVRTSRNRPVSLCSVVDVQRTLCCVIQMSRRGLVAFRYYLNKKILQNR